MEFSATQVDTLCKYDYEHEEGSGYYGPKAGHDYQQKTEADNIYNQETGDLYDQEAHIDQYAEAYINKHEEAYLDKHKETHLDKHKEIYLDEHDEACIDQHEEGYNSCIFKRKDDINEREASHIGKLKEARDNHDEASNNQSQGFNFKHQESFNNQLKEMSKEFVSLGVNGVGTRWVLGTIGVQMNLDIGTKMQELCGICSPKPVNIFH
ncbi:hypothetical protein D6C77_03758 [Aureobasidium pullulans]|nr:hypothetical protein D6C77_03758 [Aureobasidium pullulans]